MDLNTDSRVRNLDSDGNGSIDQVINPSSTLTGDDLADTLPPVTTAIPDGTQGQNGWYRSGVILAFSATDNGGAGILKTYYYKDGEQMLHEATESTIIDTEGTTKIWYFSVDKAGNTEQPKSITIKLDKTDPNITYKDRTEPNANGWNKNDVTVNWTCDDEISGVLDTSVNKIITTEGQNQSAQGICADNAGNTSQDTQTGINIDKTYPSVTALATSNDQPYSSGSWTRYDVKVIFNCTDELSGVVNFSDPTTFTQEGKDKSVNGSCIDKSGNESTTEFKNINIDKTAPEAEIKYDLAEFDTLITGIDDQGSASAVLDKTKPLQPKYTITDQAGNILIINTGKIKLGKQVALTIKNLQYNSSPVTSPDPNVFFTLALTNADNTVKQLDQYYSLKDVKKIFTAYSPSTAVTKIFTRTPGTADYTREDKPGIVLLQLFTEQGNLKYRY